MSMWYHVEVPDALELNDLAAPLGALPEGTRVELTFVVEGLAEQVHRYAGVCRERCFELERAYPQATASVLTEALELVEEIFRPGSIALSSEAEESEVRRVYQRAQGEAPKIRNGKIMPQYGSRGVVVQTLFFERFQNRGPWDIAAARKLVEDDWEEYDQIVNPTDDEEDDEDEVTPKNSQLDEMLQKMNEAVARRKEAMAVPHSEEVLYAGRTGRFFRASMSDLEHITAERLDEHDRALQALGFHCVGDSVGEVGERQEITRCYAGNQAISLLSHRKADNQYDWAPVSNGAVLVDFSPGVKEFHTHFEDGTTLVTTSVDAITSKPEAGVYIRCYEEIPVTKLWEKHVSGIARFKEHRHTTPVDHLKFRKPAELLAQVDDLFCRFLGRADDH
jgi:hypothetical protein